MAAPAPTQAPERLPVPTCIGCGAMSRPGTCASGCSEHKLELVRAVAHDCLAELDAVTHQSSNAMRPIAEGLLSPPPSTDLQTAYRSWQRRAREVLRSYSKAAQVIDDPAGGGGEGVRLSV
jgi:hypothetical protein